MSKMHTRRNVLAGGASLALAAIIRPQVAEMGKGWCSMDPIVIIDGQSVTVEGWAHTDLVHVTHAEFIFYVAPGHSMSIVGVPDCPTTIVQGSFTGVRFFFTTNDGTTEGRLQVIAASGAVQSADYIFQGGQTLHYLL